jgi:hypothetical protein
VVYKRMDMLCQSEAQKGLPSDDEGDGGNISDPGQITGPASHTPKTFTLHNTHIVPPKADGLLTLKIGYLCSNIVSALFIAFKSY